MVSRFSIDDLEETVLSDLEGTLIKDADTFPYFMLVAFQASGLLRFTLLLLAWPLFRTLGAFGFPDAALGLVAFVVTARLRQSEIELVSHAMLSKFFMDDLDVEAWRVFAGFHRRVVATRCPTVMVEWFTREHLGAHDVVGTELVLNRFGRATGLVRHPYHGAVADRVKPTHLTLGSAIHPPTIPSSLHARSSATHPSLWMTEPTQTSPSDQHRSYFTMAGSWSYDSIHSSSRTPMVASRCHPSLGSHCH